MYVENGLLYKGLFSYVGRVKSCKICLACLEVRIDSNGLVFFFLVGVGRGGGVQNLAKLG